MSARALSKNQSLPLYVRLKSVIEQNINSGEWQPDTQIPSERELCERYDISRTTVRQALTELVSEGRLVRYAGRGTFVAPHPFVQGTTRLSGFTSEMQGQGRMPRNRVLQFETVEAPPGAARGLQLEVGSPVLLLKRVRLADDEPMAVERAYLPETRFGPLLDEDLASRSLYALLERQFSITPTRAEQTLQAISCPEAEAQLLHITPQSPVLYMNRTTFSQHDVPFEWVESYYRGDRYQFRTELFSEDVIRPQK